VNIRCLLGRHAWRVFDPADWQTTSPHAWGMYHDSSTVRGGPPVRVTCARCGKRDYACFEQPTTDAAWRKHGGDPEWRLIADGRLVAGGPSHDVIAKGFRGEYPGP